MFGHKSTKLLYRVVMFGFAQMQFDRGEKQVTQLICVLWLCRGRSSKELARHQASVTLPLQDVSRCGPL